MSDPIQSSDPQPSPRKKRKVKPEPEGICPTCGHVVGLAGEELHELAKRVEVILRVMRMQARDKRERRR